MSTRRPIPAAQYLRMSTEHQQYSLENQSLAIKRYAESQGFAIVRTYSDAAKSGLLLRNRASLQRLLFDVMTNNADFKAVLVYDVSRWGRFQDVDEAAHYEFLCRQSGVSIHYCAEQFTNDGTTPNMILKVLKRVMAAEYSRELSVKCFAAQERLAQKGYRVGGQAGYGLRRMVVTSQGHAVKKLESGQFKRADTDRIILTPGPDSEVRCVQEMYQLAMRKRFSDVARILNARNRTYLDGKPWDYHRVQEVLTNPKYAGHHVWGRTTQKLRGRVRQTNAKAWIVRQNVFTPIVDQDTFDRVQAAHRSRNEPTPDDTLLKALRRLLKRKGKLTEDLMRRSNGVASHSTFTRRFGSVMRAYTLVGYSPSPRQLAVAEHCRRTKCLRQKLIEKVLALFAGKLDRIALRGNRPALRLASGRCISVLLCRYYKTDARDLERWELIPFPRENNFVVLLCLLNARYDGFHSFYVMPDMDKVHEYQIKGEHDPWLRRGIRIGRIEGLYDALRYWADTSIRSSATVQSARLGPDSLRL